MMASLFIYKIARVLYFCKSIKLRNTLNYFYSPRSPTARVHVAAGGNIIWNPFLLMAKCRGDGREPSQRVPRAVVATLWC